MPRPTARLAPVLAVLAAPVLAAPAVADPVGTFDVIGTNPGTSDEYRGTVTVTRSGEAYSVTWDIAGTRFDGTGLGGKVVDGSFLIGGASPEDIAVAVGYVVGDSFGIAMYFEGPDGAWEGVWTTGGGDTLATERWVPR